MSITLEFLVHSILVGILASYVLLAMALWSDSLGLPRLDFSRAMANVTYARTFEKDVGPGAGVDAPNTPYWPGMIVIYFNGIIFGLVFTTYVGQYLPGDAIFRGAVYGVILWAVSGVFYVPFILREGFFLSHIHPMAWFSSLIVHGMYGGVMGMFAPIRGYVPPTSFFGF
ncbi:MAG: hypothetical protein O3A84_00700 [Proteobacteria bacterium]|nr:hypothetical protein [Pseudomonadota bacterium]